MIDHPLIPTSDAYQLQSDILGTDPMDNANSTSLIPSKSTKRMRFKQKLDMQLLNHSMLTLFLTFLDS